jgi:hypothetical protein
LPAPRSVRRRSSSTLQRRHRSAPGGPGPGPRRGAEQAYEKGSRHHATVNGAEQARKDFSEKWADRQRNGPQAEKDLAALEKVWGIDATRDASYLLDDYRQLSRSDFEDAEEFADARTEAWDDFLASVDELDSEVWFQAPAQPTPVPKRRGPAPTAQTTWTEDVHEWFAKQFISYVKTGLAPAPHLEGIFSFYSQFLDKVSHESKLSPGGWPGLRRCPVAQARPGGRR